ncbi:MAG: type VI secretion system domain-containing protein, partial [Gammaproteobacteria bacterium]|nr:type VI secretion system domain-containing protein [Gammaproteobacteria bacterium]
AIEKVSLSDNGLSVPDVIQDITSEHDAHKVEKAISGLNLKLASFYRKSDIRKTASFKRLREGLWANVSMLPPNTSGKTQLPPVTPNERQALQSLDNVPESLEKLELLMQRYPFWLDIQKKLFDVCKALGSDFQEIADVVSKETQQFVSRLQGIEDLLFSDLSPVANSKTKEWIKTLSTSENSQFTIKIRRFDGRWKRIEEGLLAGDGKIGTERLLSIMDRISQARNNNEEYFQVLMIAAKVFAERCRFDLASYCVGEMEIQVEKHNLAAWNRDLVRDLYRLKLDVLRGKDSSSEDVDVGMEFEKLNKQMLGLSLLDAYNSELRK